MSFKWFSKFYGVIAFGGLFSYSLYLLALIGLELKEGKVLTLNWIFLLLFLLVFSFAIFIFVQYHRQVQTEHTLSWLIDAVNWNFERLKEPGLSKTSQESQDIEGCEMPAHWPWGGHHTEYLGHLEAAARKWWNLYDPSDSTTAPTNEMVSSWLQKERNLSGEKAKAIASMLRPDGLPTGPRK